MCKASSTDIVDRYNEAIKYYDNNPNPSKADKIEDVKSAYKAYADAAKKLEDALTSLGV